MAGAPVYELAPHKVQEVDSDSIQFAMFKRLGASIKLSHKEELESGGPGHASLLAVSNVYGATFIGNIDGLYAARTARLLELAEAAKELGESRVADGVDGVRHVGDLEGIHTLSLSADELLLAVGVKGHVLIYSTQDLIEKDNPAPRLNFNFSVRSLTWSPSDKRVLLAILDDNTLRIGDVSKGMQGSRRGDVVAASWSPDGRHVALASKDGDVFIATPDLTAVVATIKPALSVGAADSANHVQIDTLRWIGPGTILLSLVPLNEDGSEGDDSPLVALEKTSRSSFAEGASDVRELLFDGLSPSILSEATEPITGPYLHTVFVDPWNVVLVAHRKSYDDHINLVGWGDNDGREELRQWQIEDDTFIPRVDMPDSGDNFVLGLAVDRTSTQIQLYDPRDREVQLPPQPIMLHVTSEGTLSAFVFARLDAAKDLPNLVTVPRPTFAPLEDLQTAPERAPPQKEVETPEQPESVPPPAEKSAADSERPTASGAESEGGKAAHDVSRPGAKVEEPKLTSSEGAKAVDDVSRQRAAAAEAAERRAAEARAAQGQALPPAEDDLLDDNEAPPSKPQTNHVPQKQPSPDQEAVVTPLEKSNSKRPEAQKGLFAAAPLVPAFLPGSEGKQAIKPLEKPDSKKPEPQKPDSREAETQKPGLFAAPPPIPAFLPGSEGKQVIKPLAKPDGLILQPQKPETFAVQPPIPTYLPGSEGKKVIKPLDKPDSAKPQTQKPGLFAAAPPIPTFLPGSEGKQVIKPLAKPETQKPQTQKAETFAAQPPIPSFLPGSEGKQVIKPLDKTAPSLTTSPFGTTQPKPPAETPTAKPSPFGAFSVAPSQPPVSSTGPSPSPFGAFSSSGNAFAAPFSALGGSSSAFGGFPSPTPFGFSTADSSQESGRVTPAFGTSKPAAPPTKPNASPFAAVTPTFGEPSKADGDRASKPGAPAGGFAGFGTGGGFGEFRSSGGFSAFAAPAKVGPVSEGPVAAAQQPKAAQKQPPPLQGLSDMGKRESVQEKHKRRPSSPKRGHSSTDLQAESEAAQLPALDQGHVKRTAVRTAARGQGAAGKVAPQEEKKQAAGPDEEAEFLKELDEVRQMAAELDALLAPLRASSPAAPNAPLTRESLEDLFQSTADLYQECRELRDHIAGAGQRVQGLMADTHRADTWRIVLESKVEQARDERFRVLWDEKGLEPKVEAQRKGLLAKDQVLKRKLTDLQIHLQTLELRQRPPVKESPSRRQGAFGMRPRKEAAFPQREQPKPSVQSLYSTVNTQMAIAQEQASRLTHLMTQLGLSDRAPPTKSGVESTPQAEDILRSLDISPNRRSPGGGTRCTPQSSGMRTGKSGKGTVFRVPDFDDLTADVSPSKSPLPKQRLTYSPTASGGAERAGTATPQSGRTTGALSPGGGTPVSERRVAREGLSKYHAPTTTIKRGGPSQRAQTPPSPVSYPGARLARRTSGPPQLVDEASEESVYTEEEEPEAVSEGELRQAERRLSRRSPQAFGVSGSVSGGQPTAIAQPLSAQRKIPGATVASRDEPPEAKTPGFGGNPFQTPSAGQPASFGAFGQRSAEGFPSGSSGFGGFASGSKPAASTGFASFGAGGFAMEETSGPVPGPFGRYSVTRKPTSVGETSGDGFKPPAASAAASPFGFGAPISSKASPAPVPELKFDISGSKLTSAASVPAASSQAGLFSGFADVISQPTKEAGSRPGVKLTSTVSAPPRPGAFLSFAEVRTSAPEGEKSQKRDGDKRRGDRGISGEVVISDDEGPSEGEGTREEKRSGDKKGMRDDKRTGDEKRGRDLKHGESKSDPIKEVPSGALEPGKRKEHVAPLDAATSTAPETPTPPAAAFPSFGTSAGTAPAFSGFGKPFGFGAERKEAPEAPKSPNLFGAISGAPPVSFPAFGKPPPAANKAPSAFEVSAGPSLGSLSFAPKPEPEGGKGTERVSQEKGQEEEPSKRAEPGKEQQAEAPDRAPEKPSPEQLSDEKDRNHELPTATESTPVDTKPPEPVSPPARPQQPVSTPPQTPPPPQQPETPESPQTPPSGVSISPFGGPLPQQQPSATPFSSTAIPAFTPSSPVASAASPFSSPPSVKPPSPFAFAHNQSFAAPPASPSPAVVSPPPQEEKEESMDEEDASNAAGALGGFGGFGGFGLGSSTPADPSKPSPFGVTSFSTPQALSAPPSDPNALFKPASFALPGASSPFTTPVNPTGFDKPAFGASSPFGGSAFGQPASPGFGSVGFGQPASPGFGSPGQIGAATSSNQVIGGMLGGFGQSRSLGPALPGVTSSPAFGSAPTTGAFGSFAAKPSGGFGGFAGQSSGGGFAAAASSTGSGFGGFGGAAGAASPGFSGFAGAAAQGGGFGGFGATPGFGGAPSGGDPRFTQIRK